MADVKELNINNTTYDIKAKTVVDTNSGAVKMWTGTKAQYDAIVTKDSTTLYFLSDVGKIYFGDTLISNVGSNTLFDFKWTDHLLNSPNHLRADTFSWHDGITYSIAYNELLSEYNAATEAEYRYNISTVGSLTNDNGVLSNFSTSNYVKFPNNFQPGSNPWEMVFKVKTGAILTGSQYIVAICKGFTNETRYGTRIYLQENHFRITVSYNGTAWDITGESSIGTHTVQPNTDYYVKLQYTGSAYILSYSLDGETYIEDINKTSSTSIYNGNTACLIGIWNNGSYVDPWPNSIDLRESYININGQRWWTGAEVLCKISPKGYKIALATQEQSILNAYNDTGIAWYYILDTENTRFKLPRTKWGFKGLRDNVGNPIDEKLPNIKTRGWDAYGYGTKSAGTSEGITISGVNNNTGIPSGSGGHYCGFSLDASSASSTYQDNAPVQERATQMYLYFYVGDYTQSAVEQTAGLNSELFNGKADVDLTNLSVGLTNTICTTPATTTSSASSAIPAVVVENYVNGTSWYRIWSDGWIEQGGYKSSNNSWNPCSLLKNFSNTDYNIQLSGSGTTAGQGNAPCYVNNSNKTTSSFQYTSVSVTNNVYWYACGY